MSRVADRFATSVVTVWTISGRDKFGQPSYSAPVTIPATWAAGGTLRRDSESNEFIPKTVFYLSVDNAPERGTYIARGDHSSVSSPQGVEGVEIVRSFDQWDNSFFGRTDDIAVYTA